MTTPTTDAGCQCQRCHQRYRMDLMVPDALWQQIQPTASGAGGLLCPTCIVQAVEQHLGFSAFQLTPL